MANKIRLIGNANTSSNETISFATYTIALNKIIQAEVILVGWDAISNSGVSFKRIVTAKNQNGLALLIGGPGINVVSPVRDSGYSGTTISESVLLNTVKFNINGQLLTPMIWNYVIDIYTF